MLPSDRNIGFVLSAGRTGTVFLSRVLDSKLGGLRCVHEPRPSRLTLMMGNLRNRTGIGTKLIHGIFRRALEIFERAATAGRSTAEEAEALADELALEPHPLWGHRGQLIIDDLVAGGWA